MKKLFLFIFLTLLMSNLGVNAGLIINAAGSHLETIDRQMNELARLAIQIPKWGGNTKKNSTNIFDDQSLKGAQDEFWDINNDFYKELEIRERDWISKKRNCQKWRNELDILQGRIDIASKACEKLPDDGSAMSSHYAIFNSNVISEAMEKQSFCIIEMKNMGCPDSSK